jgi:hypothetical protein
VTDAGGQIFPTNGTRPSQTAGLVPGTPTYTAWNGKVSSLNNKYVGEAGFEVVVPFDGVSADCYGRWWAIWSPK